jgi:hypothetical protein
MSSTPSRIYLTSSDLDMLQTVLTDAGLLAGKTNRHRALADAAGKLIIRLFQEGKTSSSELSAELDRQIGKIRFSIYHDAVPLLHRYAIQGLPIARQQSRIPAMRREALV